MSSISTTLDILKNIELPPNIYIGGSLPLIVQNIIPYRTPKDIDLISCIPIEEHNLDHLNIKKIFRAYGFSKNNLRFELFYNPKAEFVEYDYKGHTFRFSPIYEIIDDIQMNEDEKEKEYFLDTGMKIKILGAAEVKQPKNKAVAPAKPTPTPAPEPAPNVSTQGI